jgi:hypothetical protein
MPNPKVFVIGNSSNTAHGQEHVQAIVTLRSGRQVDNQVVKLEEHPAEQQEQESGNKEKKDDEPSKATPIVKDPPRSFVPIAHYPKRLQAPKKVGSLRTF